MSYGNWLIWADLKRGMSVFYVANKIMEYYPDICKERAVGIVKMVHREGPIVSIDWEKKVMGGMYYVRNKVFEV